MSSKPKPLTFRQRYFARAVYLQKVGGFARAMGAARETWNAEYPAFAITGTKTSFVPRPPTASGEYVYPPRLLTALNAQDDEGRRDGAADDPLQAIGGGALDIKSIWKTMIDGACGTWWRPEHFPTWGGAPHPCSWFVSASIVGDVESIKHDALRKSFETWDLPVQYWYYDPMEAASTPWLAATRAIHADILRRIYETIDSGRPLTRGLIETFRSEAFREQQSREAAARAISGPLSRPSHAYVRIIPNLMREDWVAMADRAVYAARRLPNDVDRLIGELLEAGKSNRAVAIDLGVSQFRVRKIRDKLKKSR